LDLLILNVQFLTFRGMTPHGSQPVSSSLKLARSCRVI
jgi:hypothetical protein